MNLTNDHKKTLLILGVGFVIFWLFKPKLAKVNANTKINYSEEEADPKDRKPMKIPTISTKSASTNPMAKNGFAALKSYIDAYNNGESQSVLDELNREFAKEFKVKVYRRKSDSKLVVCDLEGKEIMVNN